MIRKRKKEVKQTKKKNDELLNGLVDKDIIRSHTCLTHIKNLASNNPKKKKKKKKW